MSFAMYDGIAGDAPAIARMFPDAAMVAGYADGDYAWSQGDWDLFPHAKHVYITVLGKVGADVADCESGDLTVAQAAEWARASRAAGYHRPTIYCSRDTAPAVRVATGSLILQEDYDLWIADYTGSAHEVVFPDGRMAAAVQWESYQDYDISDVYDTSWPHRAAPAPKGPFLHTVGPGNTESLWRVAEDRGVTRDDLVNLSLKYLDKNGAAMMRAYVAYDDSCGPAGADHATMGTGFRYYTENE